MRTALIAACVLTPASAAIAAPVLRSADVKITMTSPTSCEVVVALTIDGATEIEHRVDALPPSPQGGFGGPAGGQARGVELIEVREAQRVGDIRLIGRTLSLVLRPDRAAYEFAYRARQPADRAYRCPIWLPTIATNGQSRSIHLQLDLPPGSVPSRAMPAFSWTGTHGSATLGSLPAFVLVPYRSDGESAGWDVGQVMDAFAVAVFAGASAIWAWSRRR